MYYMDQNTFTLWYLKKNIYISSKCCSFKLSKKPENMYHGLHKNGRKFYLS